MENFSLSLTYTQYFLDIVVVIGYNDIIRNWGKKNEIFRSYDSVFHICRGWAWSAERQTRKLSSPNLCICSKTLDSLLISHPCLLFAFAHSYHLRIKPELPPPLPHTSRSPPSTARNKVRNNGVLPIYYLTTIGQLFDSTPLIFGS